MDIETPKDNHHVKMEQDWSDAVTSQDTPGTTKRWRRHEVSSPTDSQRAGPFQHLDLGLLATRPSFCSVKPSSIQ